MDKGMMILLIFVTASICVLTSALVPQNTILKNKYTSQTLIFLLLITIAVHIPFLDFYVSDMGRYINAYQRMHHLSLSEALNLNGWEPLFITMQWVLSRFSQEQYFYVLSVFVMYSLLMLFVLRNLFQSWQRLFVLFVYLMFPFFYTYVFNGTRQGFAIMLLYLSATTLVVNKKRIKSIILMALAFFFHVTSAIYSIVTILSLKARLKYILLIWVLASILFLTGFNQSILSLSFIDKFTQFDSYTADSIINHYGGVNRIDFYLFSVFFLFFSILLYKYIKLEESKQQTYYSLIKLYAIYNSIYLFLGFIAYSDRLAVYSWMLIPILVTYPFLNNRKYNWILVIILILFFAFGITKLPFIRYNH